jgi:hypothetical protein
MSGAIPPLPQYVFIAWCLVKHRDNFTFTLHPAMMRFIIVLLTKLYPGEMGEAYSTHREIEIYRKFQSENFNGRDHLGDISVCEKMVLKLMLKN